MTGFDDDDTAKVGDVEIMISHSTSNKPPYRQVHLEIYERISRQRIVDVRLTSEQFGILLGSSTVYASAELPPHPERIGKRMEIETRTLAQKNYRSRSADDIDSEAEAIAFGYRSNGWDSVQIGRSNTGRTVTARRWVKP